MGQVASYLCDNDKGKKSMISEIDSNPVIIDPVQKKNQMTYHDFEIIKSLGSGSYGDVYQVKKKTNNKEFAMKAVRKAKLTQKGMDIQMVIEKNVLLRNKHPFLVTLRYSFQSEKKLYMVMDYCQGGELLGFISLFVEKGLSDIMARFIGAEVLLGLEYMHKSMKVIYRDLKPENILVGDDGHLKIADFGLVKHFNNENELTKTICGTLEYFAPEIILSCRPEFPGYGIEVDIWAFGILLFEIITGQPPFTHKKRDPEIIMKKILQNKMNYPTNMKEDAKNLIQSCLRTNPKERPSWSQIKKHPFFKSIDWEILIKKDIVSPIKKYITTKNEMKTDTRPILETQCDQMYKSIKDFYYAPMSLANNNYSNNNNFHSQG